MNFTLKLCTCDLSVDCFRCCFFNLTFECLDPVQLSNSSFLERPSGSARRAAVSSRDAVIVGGESDPSRPRTTEASPGAFRKVASGQRSSPFVSLEQKRSSSGRITTNLKNYESTLKGIESLHFDNDERLHY